MTLFEVDWELVVPSGSEAYFTIFIDGEIYFQTQDGVEESGTFITLLSEEEHIVDFGLYTDREDGGTPYVKINRAIYGDLDIVAQGIEFWEKSGTGSIEIIENYLKLLTTRFNKIEAIGTLPVSEPKELQISFDWEVSSEFDYDFFEVYVDGMLILRRSGIDYGTFVGTLTNEQHTLRFVYVKDSSVSENNDLAKVSNVLVGGENWLLDGLTSWTTGGDVNPTFEEGQIVLACDDDQSSWAERTYVPVPQEPELDIANVRIKYFQDGRQVSQVSIEALDAFFVDSTVEVFDPDSGGWNSVVPSQVFGEIERYDDESGVFDKIANSFVFEHPDGYYRLLQKCNAPPGTYYLKTTARVGDITQIERLKIKAKVNI